MKQPLPAKALAQHVIALGKTGSGKSSKMRVIVEGLLKAGDPVCIVDPKGDWWGIKSSADGKKAGYPVVIFGGEHADVPLNPHAGAKVAELIATGNRPSLIDLGGWMVGERTRFWIDFASAFFKHARGKRHLVIDEVHNFAPQGKVMDPDAGKALHWTNRLASEGRGKGITLIAASQRPQKVHKDFVTSCETLIACRVIHVLDRNAIKEWIDGCGDPVQGREVLQDLAVMQRNEAWCWSPEIGFGPEKIEWPMFETYDSFSPQNARASKLKGWADVDLEEVRGKLAGLVEQAEANDPVKLRARVKELERELAKAGTFDKLDHQTLKAAEQSGFNAGRAARGKDIEVAIGGDRKMLRAAMLRAVDAARNMMQGAIDSAFKSDMPVLTVTSVTSGTIKPGMKIVGVRGVERLTLHPQPIVLKPETAKAVKAMVEHAVAKIRSNGDGDPVKFGGTHRKILGVLAQHGASSINRLALLSRMVVSGGFRNRLSELRGAGYITGQNSEDMEITEAGRGMGPFPDYTVDLEYWKHHPSFGGTHGKILDALEAHPQGIGLDDLAAAAGMQVSGGFRNRLSELRTAGVLLGKNSEPMRLNPELT